MIVAITREVSSSIAKCELTHLDRTPIDLDRAREQHADYGRLLKQLGCEVIELPAEPTMPDSVFVEDTAIILDEIAVLTHPGAVSRRSETPSIAEALRPYRRIERIEPPATLDGGDVLRVGRCLFVGASGRSNPEGIGQLRRLSEPWGYTVFAVPMQGCLHLKSAVTEVAPNTLLVHRAWIDVAPFNGLPMIDVAEGEPDAANALRIGDHVIFPERFPSTAARLEAKGMALQRVRLSELAKAEGAVTCCSLIVSTG